MSKRVAIQLSGHLRTFEQTYESFYYNVILPNQHNGYLIDIFIHTWDEIEYVSPQWHSEGCEHFRGKKLTEEQVDKLLKLYKPTKYAITPQLKADKDIRFNEFTGGTTSLSNVINVYYTKYRVNHLRLEYEQENNVHYDWVLHTRCDILYFSEFAIDTILAPYSTLLKPFSSPDNKLFYCGNHRGMPVKEEMLLAASDIIYFGRADVLNQVSSIYAYLDIEDLKANFHSWEHFQIINARKNNIEPIQLQYSYSKDWKILRLRDCFAKQKRIKNFSLRITRRYIQFVFFKKYIRIEWGDLRK